MSDRKIGSCHASTDILPWSTADEDHFACDSYESLRITSFLKECVRYCIFPKHPRTS